MKPNGEYFFFGDKKSDKQVEAEAERHAKEFEQHAKEFSDNMSKMGFQPGKRRCRQVYASSIEGTIDSFASTASRFGQELGKLLSSIKPNITVSRSIGDVTLCIPRIFDKPISVLTTSGDIEARDIHVTDLNFTSTSGDIGIELFAPLNRGAFTTTSGDINIEADANDVQISTVSGDVEIHGNYDHLKFASTSGDVELEAKVRRCDYAASVSGELQTCASRARCRSSTAARPPATLTWNCRTTQGQTTSTSTAVRVTFAIRRSGRRGSRTGTGRIQTLGDIEIR